MAVWDFIQIVFTAVVIIWIVITSKGKADRRTKELIWIIIGLVVVGNIAGYIISGQSPIIIHLLSSNWSFCGLLRVTFENKI